MHILQPEESPVVWLMLLLVWTWGNLLHICSVCSDSCHFPGIGGTPGQHDSSHRIRLKKPCAGILWRALGNSTSCSLSASIFGGARCSGEAITVLRDAFFIYLLDQTSSAVTN